MGYRFYSILKKDGKKRTIGVPDDACMKASTEQAKLLDARLDSVKFYDSLSYLHSYRSNKSCTTLIQDILSFIKDYEHFEIISLDIKDFFGSIKKYDWLMMECNYLSNQEKANIWDLAADPNGHGIVQGNPLSPTVSNIIGTYLIDPALQFLADTSPYQVKYLRYSDNIFFVVGVNANSTYTRHHFLHQLNLTLSYRIPKHYEFKIDILQDWQEVVCLGIRIGWKPRLSKERKNWYRAFFHRLSMKGLNLMEDSDIKAKYKPKDADNFKHIIQGIITYVLTFEPGMKDYINQKLKGVALD